MDIWITLAAANLIASLAPGTLTALVGSAAARSGLPGGGCAIAGILAADAIWCVVALGLVSSGSAPGPELTDGLQIVSGLVLLAFAAATLRSLGRGASASGAASGRLRLALEGFGIGIADPLALVFFIALFTAIVPEAGDRSFALCLSAVLLTTALGLVPYAAAADWLSRVGAARIMGLVSGTALALLGMAILGQAAL